MSRTTHHGDKAKEKKYGASWHWYQSTPSAWNRMFHTKPRRVSDRAKLAAVLRGEEEQCWSLGNRKPHHYYW